MNYVSVEDINIKDEDFDVVDDSIHDKEISANIIDNISLKDQDEFENHENKPLKIQEITEKKSKPHGCSQCDKRFRKKSNLLGHIRRIHEGKMKQKIFNCSICSSTFTRNMSLTNHMTNIHNIDYECSVCNVSFKTSAKLKRHLKLMHNVRKSFECPTCNATFSVRNSLKTHIARVHEKRKPHLCPECGKSFGKANMVLCLHLGKIRLHQTRIPQVSICPNKQSKLSPAKPLPVTDHHLFRPMLFRPTLQVDQLQIIGICQLQMCQLVQLLPI